VVNGAGDVTYDLDTNSNTYTPEVNVNIGAQADGWDVAAIGQVVGVSHGQNVWLSGVIKSFD